MCIFPQISIPEEVASSLIRSIREQLQRKTRMDSRLFCKAQEIVFDGLMPMWVLFQTQMTDNQSKLKHNNLLVRKYSLKHFIPFKEFQWLPIEEGK